MAQCTAHTSAGKPCRANAIHGGGVCHKHGGSAPQVKQAARARLDALVDPAIGVIQALLKQKGLRRDDVRLKAALAVLDRSGYHAGKDLHIGGEVGVYDATLAQAISEHLDTLRKARRLVDTQPRELVSGDSASVSIGTSRPS